MDAFDLGKIFASCPESNPIIRSSTRSLVSLPNYTYALMNWEAEVKVMLVKM
jgi:hypothetical protein